MSVSMRVSRWMLWGLVTLYALLVLVNYWLAPHSVPTSVLVLVPVAFALIHGAARYGWGGILAFILICLVVSNIFENVSILTGFPFGHYHYTGDLGPKLFLVPLLIGPAYISTGYLAWVIGNVLVGDVRRGTGRFTLFATPFIAAFAMVAWDVCLDPTLSTILKFWNLAGWRRLLRRPADQLSRLVPDGLHLLPAFRALRAFPPSGQGGGEAGGYCGLARALRAGRRALRDYGRGVCAAISDGNEPNGR